MKKVITYYRSIIHIKFNWLCIKNLLEEIKNLIKLLSQLTLNFHHLNILKIIKLLDLSMDLARIIADELR